MKKYLVNNGMFYKPKNRLHKAVQNFIDSQRRRVIASEDLGDYEQYLVSNIGSLNNHFQRCHRVSAQFWWSNHKKDYNMEIEGVVSMEMLLFDEDEEHPF